MRQSTQVWLSVGIALLLGAGSLAACRIETGKVTDVPRLVVTDTLVLRPLFRLGDTPTLLFGTVRSAFFDRQGQLWVADGQAATLYVFGPEGHLRQQVGRPGEGPGEFRRIGSMVRGMNDSVYVWDWGLQRLSVFTLEGTFVRAFSAAFGMWPLRGLPEGLLVMYVAPFRGGEDTDDRQRRRIVQLLRFDGSVQIDTVLTVPDAEYVILRGPNFVSVMAAPFGRQPIIRVDAAGHIWYGQTDQLALFRYDWRSGATQLMVRYRVPPVPVVQAERDSLLQHFELLREAAYSFPEYKPVFSDFMVNETGTRIWVALSRPYRVHMTSWVVFDGQGRPLGVVPLAKHLEILAISETRLAVLDSESQVVIVYELPEMLRTT
ncbi:MAG: 6-bladed beta-propeller [Rhodothermus sp.]|nr:6-bladed beta-propeller [Rhodothermus sp.]